MGMRGSICSSVLKSGEGGPGGVRGPWARDAMGNIRRNATTKPRARESIFIGARAWLGVMNALDRPIALCNRIELENFAWRTVLDWFARPLNVSRRRHRPVPWRMLGPLISRKAPVFQAKLARNPGWSGWASIS